MKKTTFLCVLTIVTIIACKSSTGSKNEVKLTLESKSDTKTSGIATFSEKNGIVTFAATIEGLTPGVHAIHIHEKADCSSNTASTAGGHWNPTFKKHGKWGETEYHKGDIGNFEADKNGKGIISFSTDQWCIGCGDPTKDILGKGIIVHKDADDFTTQPTGNAGGRVACAGIIR
jgi:superoxide dismutase, Cu-Zn family